VLVWFHITLATFRARITTIHLYLSKLYLKHYWSHFFLDTVYIAPVCQICNLQLKYRKSKEHFFIAQQECEDNSHSKQYWEVYWISNRWNKIPWQYQVSTIISG